MQAAKVLRKAVENQVKGLGFSFVEVLSPCPTIWKLNPVEAQTFVREEMAKTFAVANYRDRTKEAAPRPAPTPPPELAEIPRILRLVNGQGVPSGVPPGPGAAPVRAALPLDLRVRVAGFGGQGVLLLGQLLVEMGMLEGLEVSWLPSYGPEMRSGSAHCHVCLSRQRIGSPLVSHPEVLIAMNEVSLHKFAVEVQPGGLILYNRNALPENFEPPPHVRAICVPASDIADRICRSHRLGEVAWHAVG
jgi:2-oxoisovalerate ferredoxin oxidoreductase beta subunit